MAPGGHRELLAFLHRRGVSYSIGWTLPATTPELYRLVPEDVWQPTYNADGAVREGAHVAEFTDLLTLKSSPPGMRVIVRRERPPGAQLRFEDVDDYRLTAFVTNTTKGQLADLELRHHRRARCEDRIRIAKDTGLTNLPLQGYAQNRLWLLIVQIANDLLAWMGLVALAGRPVRDAAHALDIRDTGASRLVESLTEIDVLAPVDSRFYARRYHAPAVMDVLLGR